MLATVVASTLLLVIGLLHLYWAISGKASGPAIPKSETGKPLFVPGPLPTAGIGVVLLALSFVCLNESMHWAVFPYGREICLAYSVVFVLRAVGEFNYVGFFQRPRKTDFAYWDKRVFSPVSLLLGLCLGASVL